MHESEIGPQWQKLSEEHEAAREAYFRAFAAVDRKLSAIGRGTSDVNPSNAELIEFERTRHAWQDVLRRIGELVKKYAESCGQKVVQPTELGR
jgi:hypothetical protein